MKTKRSAGRGLLQRALLQGPGPAGDPPYRLVARDEAELGRNGPRKGERGQPAALEVAPGPGVEMGGEIALRGGPQLGVDLRLHAEADGRDQPGQLLAV